MNYFNADKNVLSDASNSNNIMQAFMEKLGVKLYTNKSKHTKKKPYINFELVNCCMSSDVYKLPRDINCNSTSSS